MITDRLLLTSVPTLIESLDSLQSYSRADDQA
jgi:hypothetical protein